MARDPGEHYQDQRPLHTQHNLNNRIAALGGTVGGAVIRRRYLRLGRAWFVEELEGRVVAAVTSSPLPNEKGTT